jgi:hypothetical protein
MQKQTGQMAGAQEKRTGTKKKFETRLEESVEQALIDACDKPNRPQRKPQGKRLHYPENAAEAHRLQAGEGRGRRGGARSLSDRAAGGGHQGQQNDRRDGVRLMRGRSG